MSIVHIKTFLSRVNYSHRGNKEDLSDIAKNQREELLLTNETKNKLVSDYRSAHMGIVAGTIAFLGFLGKDEVMNHPNIYSWFWLFIFGSILFLVAGYYIDSIFLSRQIHILSSNLSEVNKAIGEIKRVKFGKKERDVLLQSQKIPNKQWIYLYKLFILVTGIAIWALFFVGVYRLMTQI